jgi:hypothetical protein
MLWVYYQHLKQNVRKAFEVNNKSDEIKLFNKLLQSVNWLGVVISGRGTDFSLPYPQPLIPQGAWGSIAENKAIGPSNEVLTPTEPRLRLHGAFPPPSYTS